LTVMSRSGLKSVLDEDSLAFRFYYCHELQFSAVVNETGLYRLDWELSLTPNPTQPSDPSANPSSDPSQPFDSPSFSAGDAPGYSESALVADARMDNTMSLWHHRLSHASEPLIRQMAADGTIPSHLINLSNKLPFCTSCTEMNMTKKGPIPNGASHHDVSDSPVVSCILQEISIDVAGPFPKDRSGITGSFFLWIVSLAFA